MIQDTIQTLDEIYSDELTRMMDKPMTNPQHDTIQSALDRIQTLFAHKNAEYAGQGDVLGNFRRLAAQQNVPMSTAWMFLAGKHIDSIQEYVKDLRNGAARSRTQPLSERIDDLIVYALLLQVIVEEENVSR